MIAERVLSDVSQVNRIGDQVPYLPWLWRGPLGTGHARRETVRCHTGHSYASLRVTGESV